MLIIPTLKVGKPVNLGVISNNKLVNDMSTPHHVCHTSACSGPVPSHKQDTVVVVDFFAKAEVPRFVEEICGKETILDSSMPSLTIPPNGNNDFSCKVAIDNDNPCYSSFSSQKVRYHALNAII